VLQRGELLLVDGARECVGDTFLRDREVGLADRDDGGGRLLEPAAGHGQRDDRHHGDGDGERQAD